MMTIAGNEIIHKSLIRAIMTDRLHHGLLFWGPSGIGKFTSAVRLAAQINCPTSPGNPCGTCSYCRRIRLPFPFHPDVKILQNAKSPFVIQRRQLFEKFQIEWKGREEIELIRVEKEYEGILAQFEEREIFARVFTCRQANPFVDAIQLNPKKAFPSDDKSSDDNSVIRRWLIQKMAQYFGSSSYHGTIKIEQIRQLQKDLSYLPFEGKVKTVIIDDADNMLPPAQNCLLKTLEEPPEKAVIILVTANPAKLLTTIRSRCQPVPFRPLSTPETSRFLKSQFHFENSDADLISQKCDGKISKALTTDWHAQERRQEIFTSLFCPEINLSRESWAVQSSRVILNLASTENREEAINILNEFYSWLHKQLREYILHQRCSIFLPDGNPLSMEIIMRIMDGIINIINTKVFHLDLQLQLEKLLMTATDEKINPI